MQRQCTWREIVSRLCMFLSVVIYSVTSCLPSSVLHPSAGLLRLSSLRTGSDQRLCAVTTQTRTACVSELPVYSCLYCGLELDLCHARHHVFVFQYACVTFCSIVQIFSDFFFSGSLSHFSVCVE